MERLATHMGELGFTIQRASRVQHAELLVAEQPPDLMLLDPDMGNGDGWLLLGQATARVPVIVISGQGLEEDVIRGLDAGAVDYLAKPFRTGELMARVRARLRERMPAPAATTGPTTRLEAPTAPRPATRDSAPAKDERPPLAGRDRRGSLAPGDEQEPVFISSGEEARLLRDTAPSVDEYNDLSQLSLGPRLHGARARKRITLVQAALETRPSVPMHYIQAMEEEKFSLLPRGAIAEQLLRTYASYLNIDVSKAVEEYRRLHFNGQVEPIAALGGAPLPRQIPRWAVMLVAVVLALIVGFGAIWLYDPQGVLTLAERAGLVTAPAPTVAP
jgi:CheY-like chemotaxis protein